MNRSPRLLPLVLVCLLAALAPAAADAATTGYPTISKASPLKLGVGELLTLKGSGFRAGKFRNTVVFKRDSGRAVFVRARTATATRITVAIPPRIATAMALSRGKRIATRFRVRVLATRFGRRFTAVAASPVIGPAVTTATDGDGDLLSDVLEKELGLDPNKADTDGDEVPDGFEYYSAKDLNGAAVPYPHKQPYPNALDGADAATDHDGDGLTLANEYKAWKYTGAKLPLSYSDGDQLTGGVAVLDSERDVDQDGASNIAEIGGPLSGPAYWTAWVKDNKCSENYVESTYPGPAYKGMDFVDPDTDGDGILDGADDIDHDGLTNAEEGGYTADANGIRAPRRADWCSVYVSVGPGVAHDGGPNADRYARVDPFNPCKPVYSAACHKYVPLGYYVHTDTYIEDWAGAPPTR